MDAVPPPTPTGAAWLLQRLAAHGDQTFLVTRDGTWTYRELLTAIEAATARLASAEIPAGTVVALMGDYSFANIAALLALARLGAMAVPVNVTEPREIALRLEISEAAFVWHTSDGSRLDCTAGPARPPHPMFTRLAAAHHAGLVLFSSGSTGQPKAMVHDLDNLIDGHQERRPRPLSILVFLMFDHIGGLNTLLTALATGATLVLPPSREPDAVCELIARHRVAVLPTSPTFLNLVLMSGAWQRHDLGSLRIISYGTEPMPEGLLHRLREALPKARFIQTFGTSETGISQTSSKSSDSTLLKLDDPNIEHRIVDGELWLRSRTQILGYLNHAMDSFTADGWFRTGDLVETTPDGYLRIAGRRKELINVGGEKVLPAEVESVLLELPIIADCAVYGEPSAITGQIVCADVALAPGADPASIRKTVRTHCHGRIAAYKIPVKIKVVPHTASSARFKKIRPGVANDS